jgi:hypothetical protein
MMEGITHRSLVRQLITKIVRLQIVSAYQVCIAIKFDEWFYYISISVFSLISLEDAPDWIT